MAVAPVAIKQLPQVVKKLAKPGEGQKMKLGKPKFIQGGANAIPGQLASPQSKFPAKKGKFPAKKGGFKKKY